MCQAIKELIEDARLEGIREAEEKAEKAVIEATKNAEKAVIEANKNAEKAVIEANKKAEQTKQNMIESMRKSGISEEAIMLTLENMNQAK